jgi:hypothetical protein
VMTVAAAMLGVLMMQGGLTVSLATHINPEQQCP